MPDDFQALVSRHYALDHSFDQPVSLFFQPLDRFFHHNLEALAILATYLQEQTPLNVCQLVPTRDGGFETAVNGAPSVLMQLPQDSDAEQPIGSALALLHRWTQGIDSRSFPEALVYQKTEGLARSLDTLGKKYTELGEGRNQNFFEKSFVSNFPYFSGVAENAVQFLVDCSFNYPPEPLTLTHYRFSGADSLFPENPATWVADDRSRDLAEWIRLTVWTHEREESLYEVAAFLDSYEAVFPLSLPVAGRMYGRLLFPLSYVECCERYLLGSSFEDRALLEDMLAMNERKIEDNQCILNYLGRRFPDLDVPEWIASLSEQG